jgi:hypothetical protein
MGKNTKREIGKGENLRENGKRVRIKGKFKLNGQNKYKKVKKD